MDSRREDIPLLFTVGMNFFYEIPSCFSPKLPKSAAFLYPFNL